MEIGLLWFDNDPGIDLAGKVTRAAAYYQMKYGEDANLCFVHPSMLPEKKGAKAGTVAIRPNSTVLPHHYWIGVQP